MRRSRRKSRKRKKGKKKHEPPQERAQEPTFGNIFGDLCRNGKAACCLLSFKAVGNLLIIICGGGVMYFRRIWPRPTPLRKLGLWRGCFTSVR